MKRISVIILFNLFALCFCISCNEIYHHNTNIHISESALDYTMYVHYPPGETHAVENYMDCKIGRSSDMSFVNSRIDAQLTLNDHTTFYLKKYPGYLKIKLDKARNSEQAYDRIKNMCEGIKKVLAGK
ncbi:MAG TPA: hypothetical protein VHB70_07610 [Parafilimonas sp.]|nr:hypothetical protein [Parafilimonas sp.]